MSLPPIMKFFEATHQQREDLKNIAYNYEQLALDLVDQLPDNAERSVALRKLLESKEAATRAAL